MTVHLHTLCWNDLPLLEFFFRHYEPWVDRFYILDDHSDDGTRKYLASRSDVVLADLPRVNPESWVLSAKHIYDTAWQHSIGLADWVVVTNIDEHLHHADMLAYLKSMQKRGVTVVPALGYQMITSCFPRPGSLLWRDYCFGTPWGNMSKMGIFQPDQIKATRFEVGRHRAAFEGNVVLPDEDEVTNLHYKYLGIEYTHKRHQSLARRLGSLDRKNGWGHKYDWSEGRLRDDFEDMSSRLVDVTRQDHHTSRNPSRWWRREK